MATFVIFPLSIGIDFPPLSGTTTPRSIRIQPVDLLTEMRPSSAPIFAGAGPILDHSAGTPLPPVMPQVDDYTITVVDRLGATYETLTPDATCSSMRWELNGLGGGTIKVPTLSPLMHTLFDAQGNWLDNKKIALYRGTDFIKTFIPSPHCDLMQFDIDGAGPAYDLSRKFVGRNNAQPNLATNGSFDSDVVGWTVTGSTTLSWTASPYHSKPGAASIVTSSAGDNHIDQSFIVNDEPFETFLFIEAWAYIASTVSDDEVPGEELGLKIIASVSGTNVFIDGAPLDWKRVGVWQRVNLRVYIPDHQTSTIQLQLHSPVLVTIYWDDVLVRREERLYATGGPEDIIGALVHHAQDASIGKVNNYIGIDVTNSSGAVALTRAYKYAERANILSAINEISQLNRSVDWHIEEHALNDVELTTYPRTGFDDGNKQTLQLGYNVNNFTWVWDTPRRADIVAYLGRGSGDLVNEAFANDPDTDVGWERVVFATVEASIATQDAADGVLASIKRARVLRLFCHRAGGSIPFDPVELCFGAIGSLLPGRLVKCDVRYGKIYVYEDCKIVNTEVLDPNACRVAVDVIPVSAIEAEEEGENSVTDHLGMPDDMKTQVRQNERLYELERKSRLDDDAAVPMGCCVTYCAFKSGTSTLTAGAEGTLSFTLQRPRRGRLLLWGTIGCTVPFSKTSIGFGARFRIGGTFYEPWPKEIRQTAAAGDAMSASPCLAWDFGMGADVAIELVVQNLLGDDITWSTGSLLGHRFDTRAGSVTCAPPVGGT